MSEYHQQIINLNCKRNNFKIFTCKSKDCEFPENYKRISTEKKSFAERKKLQAKSPSGDLSNEDKYQPLHYKN